MKNNFIYSIRWKILFLFLLSSIFTGLTVLLLIFLGFTLYKARVSFVSPFIRWVYYDVGAVPSVIMASAIIFVVYIFILIQPSIRYLLQVIRTLQLIANGQLDHRIPVRSQDELGELAENINRMAVSIKQAIELERRTEQAKSELITNVSHDLRTPLTSIIGYLGLIDQDKYRDEVEMRYYVNIAYEKALRLHGMINDLFEYTQSSGGMKLRLATIDMGELLGQLVAEYHLASQDAEMTIQLELRGERMMVKADGDRLVRVFENLLSNALHYGKTETSRTIDVVARQENRLVIIDVVNYGPPIPSAQLPYLFDRFYRIEQSRSTDTGGTGLGLAISKNIIELHGGMINAVSDHERTVFSVSLPASTENI